MLCFDIETTGLDANHCKVTVICTEDFVSGVCKTYEFARYPERINELTAQIIEDFEACASLCAFNGVRFDIPFMVKSLKIDRVYEARWIAKTSDILEQSRLLYKKTFGLNLLCETNGIPVKISDGKEAIRMAQNGDWDRLNEYCAQDVAILCDLYRKREILHPRTKDSIDLKRWSRDMLYEEEPHFFHYCRQKLSWTPVFCQKLKGMFQRVLHTGAENKIKALQDCKYDDEQGDFVYAHNLVSQAYSDYCMMSELGDGNDMETDDMEADDV